MLFEYLLRWRGSGEATPITVHGPAVEICNLNPARTAVNLTTVKTAVNLNPVRVVEYYPDQEIDMIQSHELVRGSDIKLLVRLKEDDQVITTITLADTIRARITNVNGNVSDIVTLDLTHEDVDLANGVVVVEFDAVDNSAWETGHCTLWMELNGTPFNNDDFEIIPGGFE